MNTHLSDEQLNLIRSHKLRGSEFVEALYHIQDCDFCRERMPKRTTQEVLSSIFDKDEASQSQPKPWLIPSFGHLLTPLTVCALLLLLGSATFFVVRNGQKQEDVVKVSNTLNSPPSTVNPIDAPIENLTPTPQAAESPLKKEIVQTVKSGNEKVQRHLARIPQTISNIRTGKSNLPKRIYDAVALNPKVRFVWSKIKDAVHYEIAVFDSTYKEIARQTVKTNSYELEDSLKKGDAYFWKLIAYNAYGEPILVQNVGNVGTFQLKGNRAQQLKRLEKTNQDNLAVLDFMIEKGMLKEAKSKLEKLSTKNPKNAQIKLLTQKVDNLIKK